LIYLYLSWQDADNVSKSRERLAVVRMSGPNFDLIAGGWVEIAPGLYGPKRFSVEFEGPELPYRITMEVGYEGGRFQCSHLACERKRGGSPVSGEGIRQIPVVRLLGLAAKRMLFAEPSGRTTTTIAKLVPKGVADAGPTEGNLKLVSLVYRAAYACHYEPTKAVMDSFRVSRPTAGRWVMKARESGHLGPVEERKAGGVSE
jgi:hypothetical protein